MLFRSLLAIFSTEGVANSRAALDLAEIYLLRAKIAQALGATDAAASALHVALVSMQQRADDTPADYFNRANLAYACQWAQRQPALSAKPENFQRCGQQQAARLSAQGKLTPWWKNRLATM